MDFYTQRAAPGLHDGKNRRFSKILHLQQKMGCCITVYVTFQSKDNTNGEKLENASK